MGITQLVNMMEDVHSARRPGTIEHHCMSRYYSIIRGSLQRRLFQKLQRGCLFVPQEGI